MQDFQYIINYYSLEGILFIHDNYNEIIVKNIVTNVKFNIKLYTVSSNGLKIKYNITYVLRHLLDEHYDHSPHFIDYNFCL